MSSRLTVFTLAALAVFSTQPSFAQGSALRAPAPVSVRVVTGPDAKKVRQALADAEALEGAGRVRESRRRLRSLITEQQEAEQYPLEALWRLANSFYFREDELGAAAVLDELASSAAQFGDPASELRGTFEAAVIYQRLHKPELVKGRLARVEALLQSPAISDDAKRAVRERIVH
ncbi:MAG: hypothetical protein ACHQQ3_05465 [Gemmatimonadales bacterium]